MKNLTKLFVVAGLALGLMAVSFAQSAGPTGGAPGAGQAGKGGKGGQGQFGQMRKKQQERQMAALNTAGATPDQIKQVEALDKKISAEMMAFFEKNKDKIQAAMQANQGANGTPPPAGGKPGKGGGAGRGMRGLPPELQAEAKKIQDERTNGIKKILGSKYAAYEAAMKPIRPDGQNGAAAGKGGKKGKGGGTTGTGGGTTGTGNGGGTTGGGGN